MLAQLTVYFSISKSTCEESLTVVLLYICIYIYSSTSYPIG